MKRKIIFLILSAGTILFSCHKDELSGNDYLIFGTAYGECTGDCAVFYKITDQKIYQDNMDYYSGTFSFESSELSNEKYNIAKVLAEDIPDYLLNNPDKTFGCPDCADQGGVHVELCKNGETYFWHIDTDISQQPDEIKEYVENLLTVMNAL